MYYVYHNKTFIYFISSAKLTFLIGCFLPEAGLIAISNVYIYVISGRQRSQKNMCRSDTLGGPLPDMSDHEAMQRFFLQQVILKP